jgi:hypothetical protein
MGITNVIGMEFTGDSDLNKLKLSSKRLKSGKVQVKFQVQGSISGDQYGYLLTEPKTSLREVVGKILDNYQSGVAVGCQRHLYRIGRQKQTTELLIFK